MLAGCLPNQPRKARKNDDHEKWNALMWGLLHDRTLIWVARYRGSFSGRIGVEEA